MIVPTYQVAITVAAAFATTAGVVWEIRENGKLRSEAVRHSMSATASLAKLEKLAVSEEQRAAAAEANVASLLRSAKAAGVTRETMSAGLSVTMDTEDAAKAAIARASQLIHDGKAQAALDEYLACYRELEAIRPGSPGCQRLVDAIQNLGRTFPAALVTLAGLRDSAMAQLQAGPERRELAFAIASLNERLTEGRRTLALYDSLPPNDPGRQGLAMVANTSFIEARRYADALIGKPFGQMLGSFEGASQQIANFDGPRQAALRKAMVDGALTNIEVLTGAGKLDEARILTEKLLAFDGSDATRAMLKQHVERAGQSSAP